MNIFGRKNENGNIDVLYVDDGYPVTKLDDSFPIVYPVDSNLSAYYEHPEGITLTEEDAQKIGLDFDE
ncbi:hypothetical protein ACXITB_04275 [Proteus mirabilis]|uniref:hypothetical protein n=1 Tax=Proteus mirabilis TaxID=584 RepID=UPI0023B24EF7|nr:hypothetical protein [Proteus mirabilis]ELI8898700.1 hypothetical protein [Proteus mirabilis]MDK7223425.1 hypothetical protein [Proteus mirabilis]MDK7938322.1 hypothetical protein [Proteus mirabilis]HEI8518214.1 hypothetical protein [Proteus mirabilis]HEJ9600133.1 hypothetical protein [Proteus mirabilis]